MKTVVLTSTFSPAMLAAIQDGGDAAVTIKTLSLLKAKQIVATAQFRSEIGHPATREMVSKLLGLSDLVAIDPNNRVKSRLQYGDDVLVCQYVGRRLGEGEIMHDPKPEDFVFLLVEILDKLVDKPARASSAIIYR